MEALLALQVTAYVVAAAVGLANCELYKDWQARQEADPPAVTEAAETDAETQADAPETVIVTD